MGLSEVDKGSYCILSAIPPHHALIDIPRQSTRSQIREHDDMQAESPHEPPPAEQWTRGSGSSESSNRQDRHQLMFGFDGVFEAQSTQQEVFTEVGLPVVQSVLDGYNTCIIAYGQTGSGKTYSMIGKEGSLGPFLSNRQEEQKISQSPRLEEALLGLIPRACLTLFDSLNQMLHAEDGGVRSFTVELTCVEIYNEVVKCLLDDRAQCVIREDPLKGPVVLGASTYCIDSAEVALQLIEKAFRRRTCASTNQNKVSSRSHAICTFNIAISRVKENSNEPYTTSGAMHLVDLAGSERVYHAKTDGERLREGAAIGKSLLSLGQVIKALVEDKAHIPYRESQLTWLLKNALGGNSRTVMLTTVSPCSVNYHETINALSYADRVKSIRNRPQVNKTRAQLDMLTLQQEVKRLQDDNTSLREAQLNFSFPAESQAVLLRQTPMPLRGSLVGQFLRKGAITIIETRDLDVKVGAPRRLEENESSLSDDEFPSDTIMADWTNNSLQLLLPVGWTALLSPSGDGGSVEITGPGKADIFHGDTIVLSTEDLCETAGDSTRKVPVNRTFFVVGGVENFSTGRAYTGELRTLDSISSNHSFSRPSSPQTRMQNTELGKSPVVDEFQESPIHLRKSSHPQTELARITQDAVSALFKNTKINPRDYLPSLDEILIGKRGVAPVKKGSPKELSPPKESVFSKIHLVQYGYSFALAFDAARGQVCVVIEESSNTPSHADAGKEHILYTEGSLACTPSKACEEAVEHQTKQTLLCDIIDCFPYIVLWVNAFIERNTSNLDKKLCDIIEETAKIHKNYQVELQAKSMNENEMLEVIKTGAIGLLESQKTIEDLTLKLTRAEDELSDLQRENIKTTSLLSNLTRENLKLCKVAAENSRLKSELDEVRAGIDRTANDYGKSQSKIAALEREIQSLRNDRLDEIHDAIVQVCAPPDIPLPEEVNTSCPSCEKLCVTIADLTSKVHFSEKNQSSVKSQIQCMRSSRAQSYQDIAEIKHRVSAMRQEVDAMRSKMNQHDTSTMNRKTEHYPLDIVENLEQKTKNVEEKDSTQDIDSKPIDVNPSEDHAIAEQPDHHLKANTDLFRKVDMVDEKKLMIQRLAHNLEEKANIGSHRNDLRDQRRIENTPRSAPFELNQSQPLIEDLSPVVYNSAATESTDLDRHIMEIKRKVDRELEQAKHVPLHGDESRVLQVIREKLLTSPTSENYSLNNEFLNQV
ncbi:kinesin-like protein KIF16B-like protein [Perkinsela sp. CCAP 1560/4]|nr:kinesin-like protein KIF16B-like protein [Perkinsela sp. CCAP 1560/4]|eukprot:KNH09713.1 kinesin-like protein KIF16B-like protein [Perkinsela sp. CCAP 1560/4]